LENLKVQEGDVAFEMQGIGGSFSWFHGLRRVRMFGEGEYVIVVLPSGHGTLIREGKGSLLASCSSPRPHIPLYTLMEVSSQLPRLTFAVSAAPARSQRFQLLLSDFSAFPAVT
jgi:hypothetical protein